MEEKRFPLLGDEFPEVTVQTTHGPMKLPKDLSGKWFVLFSHPGDFTPVCTTEFVSFQKRISDFEQLDTSLVGLSVDQVYSHMKWTEWIKEKIGEEITFPIIADDLGNVSYQLGLIHPGKGANTVRAVYIVDPKGYIRLILYYPQEIGRSIEEIIRAVKALQASDQHKVALPADWPNNALIQDHAIIPPPTDEKSAKDRLNKYTCYDWWFCHQELDK
ncbi:MAG: peroxiredoxin [Candidatus Woesearchaeota archaeon]